MADPRWMHLDALAFSATRLAGVLSRNVVPAETFAALTHYAESIHGCPTPWANLAAQVETIRKALEFKDGLPDRHIAQIQAFLDDHIEFVAAFKPS